MNVSIEVKKTHPDAVLPVANNKDSGTGDTGYDLTAVNDQHIQPGRSAVVSVGLTLAYITPGYWFKIEPRSGLGFKSSIQPHLGVIDNGYRGDLGVKLYNFHEKTSVSIKKGDKIAQLVVYTLIQPVFSFADEVTETARGDKGFGSSDVSSVGCNDDVQWEYCSYTGIVTDINETIAIPKLDQGDPLYEKA